MKRRPTTDPTAIVRAHLAVNGWTSLAALDAVVGAGKGARARVHAALRALGEGGIEERLAAGKVEVRLPPAPAKPTLDDLAVTCPACLYPMVVHPVGETVCSLPLKASTVGMVLPSFDDLIAGRVPAVGQPGHEEYFEALLARMATGLPAPRPDDGSGWGVPALDEPLSPGEQERSYELRMADECTPSELKELRALEAREEATRKARLREESFGPRPVNALSAHLHALGHVEEALEIEGPRAILCAGNGNGEGCGNSLPCVEHPSVFAAIHPHDSSFRCVVCGKEGWRGHAPADGHPFQPKHVEEAREVKGFNQADLDADLRLCPGGCGELGGECSCPKRPKPPGPSSRCATCNEQYKHHATNSTPTPHPFTAKRRGAPPGPRMPPATLAPATYPETATRAEAMEALGGTANASLVTTGVQAPAPRPKGARGAAGRNARVPASEAVEVGEIMEALGGPDPAPPKRRAAPAPEDEDSDPADRMTPVEQRAALREMGEKWDAAVAERAAERKAERCRPPECHYLSITDPRTYDLASAPAWMRLCEGHRAALEGRMRQSG